MSAVGTPFAQAAMRLASAVVGLIEAAAAIPGSVEVRGEEVYN
jgi:hypothetical protein